MKSKIDTLRQMVAQIGEKQAEYHAFFPAFSNHLVQELGAFLGDPACVALCPAIGDFSFDLDHRHEGLGFEGGRYRIPLMFRLNNLNDEGALILRIRLYFAKGEKALLAWVGSEKLTFEADGLPGLLDAIYEHLTDLLSSAAWFEEHSDDYQGTHMGFHVPSRED